MADLDGSKETKEFHLDTPARAEAFFLKGSNALGWGMQDRLARIFQPASGRTVMLAIDHGYFQGPTSGLERVDVNIVPLVPYA
ncbi:MAG: 3-hydroxy-5-phosphonooxypentane-2,4-dione thiolase LsrF, partial [Acidobacteriota bacterium]|nr:3-hydroxy-5-phosphonooxypentane-2,4-dione thiolase LsrF [Acidobacteriota bacterium]